MSTTHTAKVILFQTVGTGSDKHPVWQSLAKAIHERSPDLLVLLCSTKTAREIVPKVWDELDRLEANQPRHVIHRCKDENDVESLTVEYAEKIETVIAGVARTDPGCQIRIDADFTSGTKAMSAALVAAAVAKTVPTLLYGVGNRDASGRATSTDRILESPSDQIIAERTLAEAGELYNLGQFAAAHSICRSLLDRGLREPRLVNRARTLADIATALGAWDRFDFTSALALLPHLLAPDESHERTRQAGWDVHWFNGAIEFVERCHAVASGKTIVEHIHHEWLVNLLESARRRYQVRAFDDAVSRLYRLFEAICQVRCLQHGVPVNAHRYDPAVTKVRGGVPLTGVFPLGLRDRARLLRNSRDAFDREFATAITQGAVRDLLEVRNRSLMAHGFTAVADKKCKSLLDRAENWLKRHVDDADQFKSLAMQANFPRCPWTPKAHKKARKA